MSVLYTLAELCQLILEARNDIYNFSKIDQSKSNIPYQAGGSKVRFIRLIN